MVLVLALEAISISAEVAGKVVLKDASVSLAKGELVAIMGPNGSGKTSLANVIAGHPKYKLLKGKVLLDGVDITNASPHERALMGLLLLFQSPPEVPGVKISTFILSAYNKRVSKQQGDLLKLVDPTYFKKLNEALTLVGLKNEVLYRELNVGLSGGERKRSELLQSIMLNPSYVIMDEPDSGLDVDGLNMVGSIINRMLNEGKGVILITHYTRIFKYVTPDRVVVLVNGRNVAEGGPELARLVDEAGYKKFLESAGEGS